MEKILEAREKKIINLEKMMKSDFVYIILKTNIPGEDKRTNIGHFIFNLFRKRINEAFSVRFSQFYSDFDGFYEIYEIECNNPIDIKKACIEIEDESELGRYVDLDVYFRSIISVSRNDLNVNPRKCFLCDKPAHVCARNQTHTLDELVHKINTDTINYIYQTSLDIVKKSISLECSLNPKFGLVTKENNGSHVDMSYSLMMKSKNAVAPYIALMVVSGFCNNIDKVYCDIRKIGLKAEKNMFKATNGINTHKGLIFGMGFAAAAIGISLKNDNLEYDDIHKTIKYISKEIINDYSSPQNTFGYQAYKKYGFLGARGEVMNGLPNAFKSIYVLENYHDYSKEALTMGLISIISGLEDTVLLKRSGSIDKYNFYKKLIGSIETYDEEKIYNITDECIKNNISFGGSADVLAISIFIKKMKERFNIYE